MAVVLFTRDDYAILLDRNLIELKLFPCIFPAYRIIFNCAGDTSANRSVEQKGIVFTCRKVLPAIGTILHLRRNRRLASRAFDNRRSDRTITDLRPTMRAKTNSRSISRLDDQQWGASAGCLLVSFVMSCPLQCRENNSCEEAKSPT